MLATQDVLSVFNGRGSDKLTIERLIFKIFWTVIKKLILEACSKVGFWGFLLPRKYIKSINPSELENYA